MGPERPTLSIKLIIESYKKHVITLQSILKEIGYPIKIDGYFGQKTEHIVKLFQTTVSVLLPDGVVGSDTWSELYKTLNDFSLQAKIIPVTDYPLEDDEYYQQEIPKDTIYLHDTRGAGNAHFVIQSWEHDQNSRGGSLKVGTAYIIARESTARNPKYNTQEGELFKAFNDKYWAHHLGLKQSNNVELNAKSIGIEICSYGPLTKNKKGHYITLYGNNIDPSDVYDHGSEWRGYRYWHKYSEEQLKTLKRLLIHLRDKYNLEFQKSFDNSFFELNKDAQKGKPGIWTHTNVREDKFDCFPQPELLEVLNSLKNIK